MAKSKKESALFVRNFIFGVEDSLVSTVGLVSGIAVAGVSRSQIFLTGVVLIFVEAFSMGVGSFLSEESAEEYQSKKFRHNASIILSSIVMFFSYFFAGFIPLLPYLVTEVSVALPGSILASLLALFVLGAVSGKFFKRSTTKHGFKMLLLGGAAIFIGILVGEAVKTIRI